MLFYVALRDREGFLYFLGGKGSYRSIMENVSGFKTDVFKSRYDLKLVISP